MSQYILTRNKTKILRKISHFFAVRPTALGSPQALTAGGPARSGPEQLLYPLGPCRFYVAAAISLRLQGKLSFPYNCQKMNGQIYVLLC